jgi:diguanylate cyclase (GGDEF)-like protein
MLVSALGYNPTIRRRCHILCSLPSSQAYSHHKRTSMDFIVTPAVVLLGTTTLLMLLVSFLAWRSPGRSASGRAFALTTLVVAIYAFITTMEAGVTTLDQKIFWSTLEYAGTGASITLFLIFVARFTHSDRWISLPRLLLIWSLPALNFTLAATNARHNLIWTGFAPGPPGTNTVIYLHGPAFDWVMGSTYLYVLAAIGLLLHTARLPLLIQRRQAYMLLIGAIFPAFAGVAYASGLSPYGLNILPVSFAATGLTFFVAIQRYHLFDLVPIARDALIDAMQEGVLVLDMQQRIIDANAAARTIIDLDPDAIGTTIDLALTRFPELAELCHSQMEFEEHLCTDRPHLCYLEVRSSLLHDKHGHTSGRLILLRDVTERFRSDRRLREANANLEAQLLENERLQIQLRRQAMHDRLTGLYNRMYFDEILPQLLDQATITRQPLALIMLDIDHFKQINDTFGHPEGDRVLVAFGELLRHSIRESDVACRYGGEEFILALPGMDQAQAYTRAEQIRLAVNEASVHTGDLPIRYTVSIGVGVFPDHAQDINTLLRAIDAALYEAKNDGRNCVRYEPQAIPVIDR